MADETGLSTHETLLLAALLSGQTVRAAAPGCQLSEREAYRISGSPPFRAALREASDDVIRAAVRRLESLLDLAIGTLEDLQRSRTCPASVRERAAEALIDRARALAETQDLSERVRTLEENYAAIEQANRKP